MVIIDARMVPYNCHSAILLKIYVIRRVYIHSVRLIDIHHANKDVSL